MAEEVGVAYVSLIPSARGFGKLAQRELNRELRQPLTVQVVPEVDRRQLATAFTGLGGEPVTVPVRLDERQVRTAFTTVNRTERLSVDADVSATDLIGDTRRAARAAQATHPTINVDVDVDRPLLRKLTQRIDTDRDVFGLGGRLGLGILSGIGDAVKTGIGAIVNNPIISTLGTLLSSGLAVALAPAVAAAGFAAATAFAAAVSAALIGGAGLGVIGLGAWLLKDNPAVKKAAGELATTVQTVFRDAAQPLVGPFVEALDYLRGFVVEIGPNLREMFAAVAPAIMPLTRGLTGFVQALLPGFTALVKAAGPFFKDLESTLPRLGQDVGAFFGAIATSWPAASQFLRDGLKLLGGFIKLAGIGIAAFAQWYLGVRGAITGAWEVLRQAAAGWTMILGGVRDVFRRLGEAVWGVFRRITSDTNGLVSFFRGIPNRIKSALGNTGNLLYQAGKNVVQGLIDGIKSRFGGLASIASSMAQTIRNYLPFSPAKTGPLSGGGNPFASGQTIATMLAGGMESKLTAVSSASGQLAGAVGFGGRTAVAPAGRGAELYWRDQATGDQVLDALANLIGARWGGDPIRALGGR